MCRIRGPSFIHLSTQRTSSGAQAEVRVVGLGAVSVNKGSLNSQGFTVWSALGAVQGLIKEGREVSLW